MSNPSDNPQPSSQPKTSSPIAKLLTAVLAIATTFMVVKVCIAVWDLYERSSTPPVNYQPIDGLDFTQKPDRNDKSSATKLPKTPDQLVHQINQTAGTPSKVEPGNLKAPANAKRLTGYERKDNSHIEHIAYWQVTNSTLNAVKSHYVEAAKLNGYELDQDRTEKGTSNLKLSYDHKMLIIRLNERDKNIRVLLWEIQTLPTKGR